MCRFRAFLLPVLVAFIWLLTGAIGQPPPPSAKPAKPPTSPPVPAAPKADAQATKVLDETIKGLDPKKVAWMQTDIWQQVDMQGVSFRADGFYVAGPGEKMRMDIKVYLGDTVGKLEMVSDGKAFWEKNQVGKSRPAITKRLEWKQVNEALKHPTAEEPARNELLQNLSFRGVVPLLQTIQQRMVVTRQEKTHWNGQDATKLTAVWSADVNTKMFGPQGANQRIPFIPQKLQLFVVEKDKTRWPLRLEWWGPVTQASDDMLLLQMEFRNPKLNQPLTEDQCAKVFHFEPGTSDFQDDTQRVTDFAKSRVQFFASQKTPAATPK